MSSKHQPRHYYSHKDNTDRNRKFKWYKKKLDRLKGKRNDVHIAAYLPVIMEYMLRKTKMDLIDFYTVMHLAKYNRTFSTDEFMDAPNNYGLRRVNAQMKKFIDHGIIERWEGHNMNFKRKVQYKLTAKSRLIVNEMDQLMLRKKKIPLDEGYTDHEFVTPRSRLMNNKYKTNWYGAIVAFNKAVDEESNN